MVNGARIALPSLLAAIALAAACNGGGGGGKKELTTGTYTVSGFQGTDACDYMTSLGFADGLNQIVLVTPTMVTLDDVGAELPLTGTTFAGGFSEDIDWHTAPAPGPFDCIEHDAYDFSGTITGKNEFDLHVSITWTVTSGTGCSLANAPVTLPCTSTADMTVSK